MSETLFTKIIRGEIPSEKVYEDDRAFAFRDIDPKAPVHVLVVPKEPIARLSESADAHESLLGHLLLVCRRIAAQEGIGDAFRVVINDGEGAGQSVFHLHLHVLGGRPMTWPPG